VSIAGTGSPAGGGTPLGIGVPVFHEQLEASSVAVTATAAAAPHQRNDDTETLDSLI